MRIEPEPNRFGEVILCTAPDGVAKVEVYFDDETSWLTLRRIAEHFGIEIQTISYHLKEIFDPSELDPGASVRGIRGVQIEG